MSVKAQVVRGNKKPASGMMEAGVSHIRKRLLTARLEVRVLLEELFVILEGRAFSVVKVLAVRPNLTTETSLPKEKR